MHVTVNLAGRMFETFLLDVGPRFREGLAAADESGSAAG